MMIVLNEKANHACFHPVSLDLVLSLHVANDVLLILSYVDSVMLRWVVKIIAYSLVLSTTNAFTEYSMSKS